MQIFAEIGTVYLILAAGIAVFAGFVKGAVGFALPMVMISGLGSFLAPEIALAALILPAVTTNLIQALRNGVRAALESVWRFRIYVSALLVFLAFSAQLVLVLPSWSLFLILGVPVTLFATAQLLGWRMRIRQGYERATEIAIGATAGFIGGISGVWGPQTVAYLTAMETPKVEQMRVQGVVYGSGALMLLAAHLKSGVLSVQTLPLSLAMLLPAVIGIYIGFLVQDRLDQEKFRRATLLVLIVAGLNLVRRGLFG